MTQRTRDTSYQVLHLSLVLLLRATQNDILDRSLISIRNHQLLQSGPWSEHCTDLRCLILREGCCLLLIFTYLKKMSTYLPRGLIRKSTCDIRDIVGWGILIVLVLLAWYNNPCLNFTVCGCPLLKAMHLTLCSAGSSGAQSHAHSLPSVLSSYQSPCFCYRPPLSGLSQALCTVLTRDEVRCLH